jgi:hypothetical protein
MIKIRIERFLEQDFYLEDERELARDLISMGHDLEPGGRIVEENPSPQKVKALRQLLRRGKAKVDTIVTIEQASSNN